MNPRPYLEVVQAWRIRVVANFRSSASVLLIGAEGAGEMPNQSTRLYAYQMNQELAMRLLASDMGHG